MVITINSGSKTVKSKIGMGESLLDAINRAGIEGFDAPCGGKGTCGKCRVSVSADELKNLPEADGTELKLLSVNELSEGTRLACRVFPSSDVCIAVSAAGREAVIQSAFEGEIAAEITADKPVVVKRFISLPEPSIDDQRSDLKRLSDELSPVTVGLSIDELRRLPSVLRKNGYRITATEILGNAVSFEGGNTTKESWAVSVDIGTTTVVAYLVQLAGAGRGNIIDLVSSLNSQKGYGGDVISRIEFCMQNEKNLDELQRRITGQVAEMVRKLSAKNNINLKDINLVTVAGNTTMTHLFTGLDPSGIAAAPFIPVDTGLLIAGADEFGLGLPNSCRCAVLPGIASYVGSDITSGIAATGMNKSDELSLLIDIGTNGEIVLGDKFGMTACSTAAGPALEGANISCGMGGVPGAINSLAATEQGDQEVFSFSVIGDVSPSGICGSGIVDAVALFVKAGVIDETGRILKESELHDAGVSQSWINCIMEKDDSVALKISENIFLTQKDIREIQMAKAAISAGVKTLLAETGKTAADVGKLYIAGGFGAAMNRNSAAVIGLFPPELESSVVISGNTAGKGAVLAALSAEVMNDMKDIAEQVKYIELSTSVLFQQEYMTEMYFHS